MIMYIHIGYDIMWFYPFAKTHFIKSQSITTFYEQTALIVQVFL